MAAVSSELLSYTPPYSPRLYPSGPVAPLHIEKVLVGLNAVIDRLDKYHSAKLDSTGKRAVASKLEHRSVDEIYASLQLDLL